MGHVIGKESNLTPIESISYHEVQCITLSSRVEISRVGKIQVNRYFEGIEEAMVGSSSLGSRQFHLQTSTFILPSFSLTYPTKSLLFITCFQPNFLRFFIIGIKGRTFLLIFHHIWAKIGFLPNLKKTMPLQDHRQSSKL